MVRPSGPAGGRFPTALVTGFDPFGGAAANPSAMAAQALHGREIAGHRMMGALLPTVFGRSIDRMLELLRRHRPAMVICCGQAGGRAAISLERIAINIDDARITDNARVQPLDMPVVPGGPAAYFTRLPIKAMLLALQGHGIAAEVSQTAGTFVCNHVFYGLMHELATQPELKHTRGGLVHVPWLPAQGDPSMALAEIVQGLRIAIHSALTTTTDIRKEAGALN